MIVVIARISRLCPNGRFYHLEHIDCVLREEKHAVSVKMAMHIFTSG